MSSLVSVGQISVAVTGTIGVCLFAVLKMVTIRDFLKRLNDDVAWTTALKIYPRFFYHRWDWYMVGKWGGGALVVLGVLVAVTVVFFIGLDVVLSGGA